MSCTLQRVLAVAPRAAVINQSCCPSCHPSRTARLGDGSMLYLAGCAKGAEEVTNQLAAPDSWFRNAGSVNAVAWPLISKVCRFFFSPMGF